MISLTCPHGSNRGCTSSRRCGVGEKSYVVDHGPARSVGEGGWRRGGGEGRFDAREWIRSRHRRGGLGRGGAQRSAMLLYSAKGGVTQRARVRGRDECELASGDNADAELGCRAALRVRNLAISTHARHRRLSDHIL